MNVVTSQEHAQCSAQCEQRGWKRQFMQPHGWVGGMVGRLMARKNAAQTLLGVDLFEVQSHDHVLEIGFGPGVGIEEFSARAVDGKVCGADWSDAMVELASKRNRVAIEKGRVELRQGAAERLPYPDGAFDKVFEANNFHIWPDRVAALREIRRVLKPGGQLMLCLRMKHPTRTKFVAPGHTERDIVVIRELLEQSGFTIDRQETRTAGRTVNYLIASKPD